MVYLPHRLSLGGWNRSFQGVSAAHVFPKVTSNRPLCSPRGERELAFCVDGVQPPFPSSTTVDRDGTGLLRSVCLDQDLRLPLQRVRSEPGRLSFDAAQRRPKLVLERVCRCIQRGAIPYSICGLGSPVPSSQGLIGTLGGLDGRYTLHDQVAMDEGLMT